eukprot:g3658.t1
MIILFYLYTTIADPAIERELQLVKCKSLSLKGRVKIATEGINGSLAGRSNSIRDYMKWMKTRKPFQCIEFKTSGDLHGQEDESHVFPKLFVERKKQILVLQKIQQMTNEKQGHNTKKKEHNTKSEEHTAKNHEEVTQACSSEKQKNSSVVESPFQPATHLSPREFHQELLKIATKDQQQNQQQKEQKPEQTTLIDVRNFYESDIGHFRVPSSETIFPLTRRFTDFPNYFASNEDQSLTKLRDSSKILMYCTGGIRCERASSFLIDELGIDRSKVFQLKGGIHKYVEEFPEDSGGFYKGKNFVFDRRIALSQKKTTTKVKKQGTKRKYDGTMTSSSSSCSKLDGKINKTIGSHKVNSKSGTLPKTVTDTVTDTITDTVTDTVTDTITDTVNDTADDACTEESAIVGKCLRCMAPCDEYFPKEWICANCKVCVLVCKKCRNKRTREPPCPTSVVKKNLICKYCRRHT